MDNYDFERLSQLAQQMLIKRSGSRSTLWKVILKELRWRKHHPNFIQIMRINYKFGGIIAFCSIIIWMWPLIVNLDDAWSDS